MSPLTGWHLGWQNGTYTRDEMNSYEIRPPNGVRGELTNHHMNVDSESERWWRSTPDRVNGGGNQVRRPRSTPARE
jgi:hypothetical protein